MWRWIVGAVAITALGGLLGYVLGHEATQPIWLTGQAHVSARAKQATFRVGDWSYGIHSSVPWYDQAGTFHDDGWPDCLTDQSTAVRFLALSKAVDLVGKPVLAIDCR